MHVCPEAPLLHAARTASRALQRRHTSLRHLPLHPASAGPHSRTRVQEAAQGAREALSKVELPKIERPKLQLPKLELPKADRQKLELPSHLKKMGGEMAKLKVRAGRGSCGLACLWSRAGGGGARSAVRTLSPSTVGDSPPSQLHETWYLPALAGWTGDPDPPAGACRHRAGRGDAALESHPTASSPADGRAARSEGRRGGLEPRVGERRGR